MIRQPAEIRIPQLCVRLLLGVQQHNFFACLEQAILQRRWDETRDPLHRVTENYSLKQLVLG